jgi:hypothetical protein
MPGITISFMEIGDLNEAAKVLSIAMLDNPMHVAVYQGADENSRLGIEKDFSQLLRQRPRYCFCGKRETRDSRRHAHEFLHRKRRHG